MTTEMIHLSSAAIVERYLSFFRAHGHHELPGSPLAVPGNSTSFIIAGMQPLLPYLRGQEAPPSPRLTALQRCLRTDDVDAVGTNGGKNTSFHMLGNWSIGDYDKRTAIEMAMELLVNDFGLDQSKLWVTVFAGDPEFCILPDDVAIETWQKLGIPRERIVSLGAEDNLWTMGDGPGPCGPDSEIFFDRGVEFGCGSSTCRPGCECERFLEIWNLVFMEYERLPNGALVSLPLSNIDTGMGLERIASVLQEAESVFSIDLFMPAQKHLQALAPLGVAGGGVTETKARRMIVDHIRAVLLAGVAGVLPGRDGRNSVVRRLIRRAARQGRVLGITRPFLSELLKPLAEAHGSLLTTQEHALVPSLARMLAHEEVLFERVLTIGLRYLSQVEPDEHGVVSGEHLFKLHAERGFPSDLAAEVLAERGLRVDWPGYERAWESHRNVSRMSVEKHFQGV